MEFEREIIHNGKVAMVNYSHVLWVEKHHNDTVRLFFSDGSRILIKGDLKTIQNKIRKAHDN